MHDLLCKALQYQVYPYYRRYGPLKEIKKKLKESNCYMKIQREREGKKGTLTKLCLQIKQGNHPSTTQTTKLSSTKRKSVTSTTWSPPSCSRFSSFSIPMVLTRQSSVILQNSNKKESLWTFFYYYYLFMHPFLSTTSWWIERRTIIHGTVKDCFQILQRPTRRVPNKKSSINEGKADKKKDISNQRLCKDLVVISLVGHRRFNFLKGCRNFFFCLFILLFRSKGGLVSVLIMICCRFKLQLLDKFTRHFWSVE